MDKKIIIDANFPNEARVVSMINDKIDDIEYETASKQQNKGNIYLAKITRVEASLQAAFIDYGNDKSGFLPFSEIHPDYHHIPVSDQKHSVNKLKEIAPSQITEADLDESQTLSTYSLPLETEELDIKAIEKLVDEKIQSELNIEAADNEIENIHPERTDSVNSGKNYKIQEVIKKGQIVLVQATKEERGNKGASFTTFISIAGRYCVLMPNKPLQNGISRKISNADERKRLKKIITDLTSSIDQGAASVIARTAAIGHSTLEIKRDYDCLTRLWNRIREATLKSKAPCFIHEEEGIIQKTLRDIFDNHVKEVMIQGDEAYQAAQKFMKEILPTEATKIKEYRNKVPIFTKFNIEDQLFALYQPMVNLLSGGYIVINPTEALISIDVNSGRATSERNIEETALKTNLEAAKEIARQAKLRDLSGLLVIDFIDMEQIRNRKIIERSLKEFFSRDKARIQTGNISSFGLLEMSRQRMRPSFSESNSTICIHCNGKGLVRAEESNSLLILRTVENEIFNENVDIVNVYANSSTVIHLLNNKRKEISFIEEKYSLKLNCNFDPNASSDSYSIEKIKLSKRNQNSEASQKAATQTNFQILDSESASTSTSINTGQREKWKNPKHSNSSRNSKPAANASNPVVKTKEIVTESQIEVLENTIQSHTHDETIESKEITTKPKNNRKRIYRRPNDKKKVAESAQSNLTEQG